MSCRTADDSNCSPAQPWNPAGQDAMWTDWGFPVFLVEDTSQTDLLYNCSVQYNSAPLAWPLCSVEMKAHMYGAKDSQTCLRRSNLFRQHSVIELGLVKQQQLDGCRFELSDM